MLADRAKIEVQAGRGGDGSLSFRRESRGPQGGPDGGGAGGGTVRHGAAGDRLVIGVPPGTTIERWDGRRYDLVRPGQEVTLASGGAGGGGGKQIAPPGGHGARARAG